LHTSHLPLFNITPPPPLYPLSLHDALPIYAITLRLAARRPFGYETRDLYLRATARILSELNSASSAVRVRKSIVLRSVFDLPEIDRKSTRLNSSHLGISYAVFCLKKKKKKK